MKKTTVILFALILLGKLCWSQTSLLDSGFTIRQVIDALQEDHPINEDTT